MTRARKNVEFVLPSRTDPEAQAAKEVVTLGLRWLDANLSNFSLRLADDDTHRIQLVKPLGVLAARPDLIMIATILASFHAAGFRNRKLMRFVRYLSSTNHAKAIQLPNWRMLDLRLAISRLTNTESIPKRLVRAMWSHQEPEPWLIDNDSAYGFTHEVFYVTDFGRAWRRYPKRTREYVSVCLAAWLEIFYRKRDLDVVSELFASYIGTRDGRS